LMWQPWTGIENHLLAQLQAAAGRLLALLVPRQHAPISSSLLFAK